jgi:hypothetical protein
MILFALVLHSETQAPEAGFKTFPEFGPVWTEQSTASEMVLLAFRVQTEGDLVFRFDLFKN